VAPRDSRSGSLRSGRGGTRCARWVGPGGTVGRGCSLDSAYLRRFDASRSFGFNSNTLRRVCGEQHPNQKIRRCYQGFQSSARAKSEGTASLHYRAYAFLSKQQWQLAAADYGAIIKTVPKDEAALEKRAYVYEKLGRHKPAIADYTTLMEKKPNDAELYRQRGIVHRLVEDYPTAASDFRLSDLLLPNRG